MPVATFLEIATLLLAAIAVFSAGSSLSASVGFAFLALVSFGLSWLVRCPRCGLQVHSTDGVRKFAQTAAKHCERCGRTRIGVWPLQYKMRPEPWDGVRESGNQPPVAGLEFSSDRLAMKRLWLVTLLLVTSCGDEPRKPPPIAQNLDVSIENKEWPERLAQHFPVGAAEVVVLDTLQSQGFAIDRRARTAKARWTKGICEHDVDVSWQAGDAGKITGIGGRYLPTCP